MNQAVYMGNHDPMCPSCKKGEETCRHVLGCDKEGLVKALNCTIDMLDNYMRKVGKNVPLRNCVTAYARKREGVSMEHIVWNKVPRFYNLGQSMYKMGWRRYMEE